MRLCKLIGHIPDFYYGPYPVCKICGAHGLYDDREYDTDWFYWPLRWYIKVRQKWEWWQDNRKAKQKINSDDIPF